MSDLKHTFPTYHKGQIPEVLHWWNPKHYWYLLVWLFFQPSKLRQYLWLADSELYCAIEVNEMMRQPAYRNLWLMMPPLSLSVVTLLWVILGAMGVDVLSWTAVAGGVVFGVALGMFFGMIFGTIFDMGETVICGVAGGMAGGIAVSSVAFGMAGGTAGGMAIGVAGGVAFGMAIGVILGLGEGLAEGVSVGVAGGMFFGLVGDVAFGVAFSVGWVVGLSRLPFTLIYWLLGVGALNKHVASGDELLLLPVPQTHTRLAQVLAMDWNTGIYQLARVATNPFQRGYVQAVLTTYLHQQANPLATLYGLCWHELLDEYYLEPMGRADFRDHLDKRVLLLSEVGQIVPNPDDRYSRMNQQFVWRLTRWQRDMNPSPIATFSAFLALLFESYPPADYIYNTEFLLEKALLPEFYWPVSHYPHGREIIATFDLMRAYFPLTSMADIAASPHLETLTEPLLRPAVVQALLALGDVAQHATAYQEATNATVKATALNLAAGQLRELDQYTATTVLPPERALIQRIIYEWQQIIATEQGVLGAAAVQSMSQAELRAAEFAPRQATMWARPLQPFSNPYIVGDPVYPPLFVGRTDIFNRITHVWGEKENPDSIILYGHRRMGKSSILRNLAEYAPEGHLLAYLDMGGETSFVESTADLLLTLADKLYDVTHAAYPDAPLAPPEAEAYSQANRAQRAFNQLGAQIERLIAPHTLILALDEFEAIERAVEAGKVGPEIFQFLRTKSQERWLTLVFGGLHTLDEMSRDYHQPFYGSYSNIHVSYLDEKEARRLITNPSPSFRLNYEPEAVADIIAQTGGQPYLVQLLCRDALDHLNQEMFDAGIDRLAKINRADVAWAMGDDLFRRGAVYFDGVWRQTSSESQRQLLRQMATQPTPWSLPDLQAALPMLDIETIQEALRWGERHDVLRKTGADEAARWGFYVPLFRRWVGEKK